MSVVSIACMWRRHQYINYFMAGSISSVSFTLGWPLRHRNSDEAAFPTNRYVGGGLVQPKLAEIEGLVERICWPRKPATSGS